VDQDHERAEHDQPQTGKRGAEQNSVRAGSAPANLKKGGLRCPAGLKELLESSEKTATKIDSPTRNQRIVGCCRRLDSAFDELVFSKVLAWFLAARRFWGGRDHAFTLKVRSWNVVLK